MSLSPDVGSELLGASLEQGGTVRVGGADPTLVDVEGWAAANDRSLIQLDTVDCASGGELIDAICEVFAFPEDSVSDWDSLDDALGDYDVGPAAGLLVVWSNWDSVALDDEPAMAVAVDVLRTAAQSWCDDGVPWTVLVAGDGPAWDLPWAGEPPAPWEHDDSDDEDDDEEQDDAGDAGGGGRSDW